MERVRDVIGADRAQLTARNASAVFGVRRPVRRRTVRFRRMHSKSTAAGWTAKTFVIATGSRPAIPPVPGLDAVPYLTNETLFRFCASRYARSFVVGGGPIGSELRASGFAGSAAKSPSSIWQARSCRRKIRMSRRSCRRNLQAKACAFASTRRSCGSWESMATSRSSSPARTVARHVARKPPADRSGPQAQPRGTWPRCRRRSDGSG